MDLSAHTAVLGLGGSVAHRFEATAGYGSVETCSKTVAGTFQIGARYELSPRKRLKWSLAFGGGCVGDQIVHTVGAGTMYSSRGTDGCIGLFEADAKVTYDALRVGDRIVIVD